MKVKTALATVLAVTSCLADQQADYVARLKVNPTEDFSVYAYEERDTLASADALVYFQDHKNSIIDHNDMRDIGMAHALKHHMLGDDAYDYATTFTQTLMSLTKDK